MPELIVRLKGRELSRSPITRALFNIGRDPSNDVVIDNPSVSRVHAAVALEGGVFVIRDKESSNGFYVKGERRRAHVLRDGDEVQLGKFCITFAESAGPSAEALMLLADGGDTMVMNKFVDNPDATTHLNSQDLHKALEANQAREASDRRQAARERELERQLARLRKEVAATRMWASLFAGVAIALLIALVATLIAS